MNDAAPIRPPVFRRPGSRLIQLGTELSCSFLVSSVATFNFEETLMKRVIATLVLCLTIATVVGCGSGTPTGAPKAGAGAPASTASTKAP